ncbi:hypothetical protein SUGI_0064490 [Cryptomeria japonica]|nr:hypothetical protein SUGI_0064490 [Cryptomeria japonica]
MDSSESLQNPHVVIVPALGMGHLMPLLELSKRLASLHAISITLITVNCNLSPRQLPVAQNYFQHHSLPIHFIDLPEVQISPEKMKPVTLKTKVTQKSATFLENVLKNLLISSRISAFVTDMFNTAFLDVAAHCGIPSYIFSPSPATFLRLMFHFSDFDLQAEISDPVEIPGLPPMHLSELPSSLSDRSDPCYALFLYNCSNLRKAQGFIINTFRELDRPALETLEAAIKMPAVYPIGPVISQGVVNGENPPSDCLKWLDQQPDFSVIFISFGSEAILPPAQITELALGLEASGLRFMWVLRGGVLPQGFESHNAGRGFVVTGWAPQVSILSHSSTAAFVSHCGWNSSLESILFGVPIVAWPVQAEQKMNRLFLVKQLRVAIQVKMEEDGFVPREEVERAVREVMEAEEVRRKMKELQEGANSALRPQGSSHSSLLELLSQWKGGSSLLPCGQETGEDFEPSHTGVKL